MSKSIVMDTPTAIELHAEPRPVTPDWVLSGKPLTQTHNLVRSHDWTSNAVVWECTAGTFKWVYTKDEALVVVSGEAFISTADGGERRLGPGDFAFFPAGNTCTWRVPDRVRKVAILKENMWRPFGVALKVWSKALQVSGLKGKSAL